MPVVVSVAGHGLFCTTPVLAIGSVAYVGTRTWHGALGAPGAHGPLAARVRGRAVAATPTSLAGPVATCGPVACHGRDD
jgi:hypothetical protein